MKSGTILALIISCTLATLGLVILAVSQSLTPVAETGSVIYGLGFGASSTLIWSAGAALAHDYFAKTGRRADATVQSQVTIIAKMGAGSGGLLTGFFVEAMTKDQEFGFILCAYSWCNVFGSRCPMGRLCTTQQ
jgi:MFS family permease